MLTKAEQKRAAKAFAKNGKGGATRKEKANLFG